MSTEYKLDPSLYPIPRKAQGVLLRYLFLQWDYERKAGILRSQPRHSHYVFSYYKNFRMKNRLLVVSPRTSSLSLLKTQFAKKPKNPV